MAIGVNRAILIGHLGKDPEVKYTAGGKAVTSLSLATTETTTKDGDKKEYTEWHRIVAWGRLAEVIGEYLHKGSLIYIEGNLRTRKWTDKAGVERHTTEIIANTMQMLDSKPGAGNSQQQQQKPKANGGPGLGDNFDLGSGTEDDIPF